MTRKEAIELLDNLIGMVEDNHNSDYDTAFKMAIKALVEQEPKTEQEDDYFRKIAEVAISQLRADRDRLEDELAKREQEPCEDAISRGELLKAIDTWDKFGVDDTNSLFRLDNLSLPHYVPYIHYDDVVKCIKGMPSVKQEPRTGHCKDCKYFEYDSVVTADGIPLIVAHEICSKWGDGCKTKEDGYCFLFEPIEEQESEDKE